VKLAGAYVELVGRMNRLESDFKRAGAMGTAAGKQAGEAYGSAFEQSVKTHAEKARQALNTPLRDPVTGRMISRGSLGQYGNAMLFRATSLQGATIPPELLGAGVGMVAARTASNTAMQIANSTTARMASGAVAASMRIATPLLGIYGAYRMGKMALEESMQSEEASRMFVAAMGAQSEAAQQWADRLAQTVARENEDIMQNVAVFKLLFDQFGIGEKAALDMSKGLIELQYKLSAVSGARPEEVYGALLSALAGRARALRQFGIRLDETNVKETAYRLGLAATGSELNETQKALATYAALMERSTKIAGDLNKVQELLRTRVRSVGVEYREAFRAIGEAGKQSGLVDVALKIAKVPAYAIGAMGRAFTGAPEASVQETEYARSRLAAKTAKEEGLASFWRRAELNRRIAEEDIRSQQERATQISFARRDVLSKFLETFAKYTPESGWYDVTQPMFVNKGRGIGRDMVKSGRYWIEGQKTQIKQFMAAYEQLQEMQFLSRTLGTMGITKMPSFLSDIAQRAYGTMARIGPQFLGAEWGRFAEPRKTTEEKQLEELVAIRKNTAKGNTAQSDQYEIAE